MDWKELKEGQIFKVPAPTSTWQNKVEASYGYGAPLTYIMNGGYVKDWASGLSLFSSTRNAYLRLNFNQEVVLCEDLPLVEKLTKGARVNQSTGTDPEIFVVRGKEKAELLPAFRFLPTKEYADKEHDGRYAQTRPSYAAYSYRDGFAAECFVRPGTCHGYLIDYIREGLGDVYKKAQAFDRTARLTIENTFTIPKVTMDAAAEEDVALGCMPSLNAYGDSPELPSNGREFPMRFAGGHVHLGIKQAFAPENVVRGCDIVAGIPAVAIFASMDKPARRRFYGRAGEYRRPEYGLEYRTLSNAFLATPETTHLMFNLVRAGARVGSQDYLNLFDTTDQQVQDIINFCDVDAARKYVLAHLDLFDVLLQREGIASQEAARRSAFKEIIEGGIEALFPDFADIETNWRLKASWNGHSNNLDKSWGGLCNKWSKKVSSLPGTVAAVAPTAEPTPLIMGS